MAALTFATLKNSLQRAIDRRWPDQKRLVTPDDISQWVNSAYHELDRKLRWTRGTVEIDTEEDIAEYAVDSSAREWLAVEYVDEDDHIFELQELFLSEYVTVRARSTTSGRPRYFLHHGDSILVWPAAATAAETIRIWAVSEPDDLADAADAASFPEHLQQLIVDVGLAYACRYFGEYEQAISILNYVENEILRERKEPAADRGTPKRVQHRGI